jgi:DEAD/DEAH box helicase domain-containing protein
LGHDYFSIDLTSEQEEEDEIVSSGSPDTFFLMPYEKEKFFNPVAKAHSGTMNIVHGNGGSVLD